MRSSTAIKPLTELVRVVLLDDHPLYREGLMSFVQKTFPQLTFVYAGNDFREAQVVVKSGEVDLAITDLRLGDNRTPSEIISLFTSKNLPVLVVSSTNSFESVKSAFSMGAIGFVSKDSSSEEIGKAIKSVLAGREWVSKTHSDAMKPSGSASSQLSAQEKKALILYASGLKLEVVARRMDVAPSTVKQYIDRSKVKFRNAGIPVRTKTDLYKVLRDEGLVE